MIKNNDTKIEEEMNDSSSEENKKETNDDTIESEIEALKTTITDFENKYKRALADYQNLEKRAVEEKKGWIQLANKELLMRLLPSIDMMMLAAKHVHDKGLDLSLEHFQKALEQEGVKKIETIGKKFDPHLMECIQTIDGEDGEVIEETRSGYMLYDKIIRTAQVIVGKKKE